MKISDDAGMWTIDTVTVEDRNYLHAHLHATRNKDTEILICVVNEGDPERRFHLLHFRVGDDTFSVYLSDEQREQCIKVLTEAPS